MEEAYAATKMAVYDAMYNYDLSKFTTYSDLDSNRRTINAIKQIITSARNSEETKITASLNVKPEEDKWKIDTLEEQYVSKIYTVKSPVENKNIQLI